MRLNGEIAIVTGGSRGIGRAIVERFCSEGAIVHFTYLKSEELARKLEESISDKGGTAIAWKVDGRIESEVENMVSEIFNKYKQIDTLVNNAGIVRDLLIMSMEPEDFGDVVYNNLLGVFNFSKYVSRYMIMRKKGKIVNISSVVGDSPERGQCNYAASKAGIDCFTKTLAIELGPKGVNVNAVAPGIVIVTDQLTEKNARLIREGLLRRIPLGRLGQVDDVANSVLFFASAESDYITGTVLRVDGGYKI